MEVSLIAGGCSNVGITYTKTGLEFPQISLNPPEKVFKVTIAPVQRSVLGFFKFFCCFFDL
jgi:hypothetical protein